MMLMTVTEDPISLTAEEMEGELEDRKRTIKAPVFAVAELVEREDLSAYAEARMGVPVRVHWARPYTKELVLHERGTRALHQKPFSYWRQWRTARLRETLCGTRIESVATDQLDRTSVHDAGPFPVCEDCLTMVQQRVLTAVEMKARRVVNEVRDGKRAPEELPLADSVPAPPMSRDRN